jgi:hypothetical protein
MHATGRCPLLHCVSKEFRRAVSRNAASFSQLFYGLALSCVLLAPANGRGQTASGDGPPAGDQKFECSAEPSQVKPGQLVRITVKPLRSDLLYAFGSSGGTLTVTGNSALLNTVGMKVSVTVVCSAVDRSGRTVQATVTVDNITPPPPPPPQPPPVPANMTVKQVSFDTTPPAEAYTFGATIAPSLSWTTGTQTQTIAGGSMLLSDVRTISYCDPKMIQFGLAANASDTSTTKLTGPTTNLDNNDLKLNATKVAYAPADRASKIQYARGYVSADAEFFGNNSLGIGLQQAYTADFQFYLRECKDSSELGGKDEGGAKKTESKPRFFASLGVGAGYMDQRLYATANKLNAAILPLTAQFSVLKSSPSGIPPKYIFYGLLGYMPVLTDLHAYQVGATAGLQIPTRFRWMTVNLTETDLYMNNAPTGFKRNYQNGTVSFVFSIPQTPAKVPNMALPESAKGSCYGGDKLARLYCYDDVTADACAAPSIFRAKQHCASTGAVPGLIQLRTPPSGAPPNN